jgi:hypothetical protein
MLCIPASLMDVHDKASGGSAGRMGRSTKASGRKTLHMG